jgi:hypothetical protein
MGDSLRDNGSSKQTIGQSFKRGLVINDLSLNSIPDSILWRQVIHVADLM